MKFAMKEVYAWFSDGDGFGEFCTVISLVALIVLAACGRLTEAFAAGLTAINGFGIIHDNVGTYLAAKLGKKNDNNN
jgi:hypothetical protein